MISTDIIILILLYANPGAFVPISALRQWANNAPDFDQAASSLIGGSVVTIGQSSTGEEGLLLDALAGGDIIRNRAIAAGYNAAQLALIEEMLVDASGVPTTVNPFRDAALAQGLNPGDAAYADLAARTVAARRARRTRQMDLIEGASRAGAVSRIAGENLT